MTEWTEMTEMTGLACRDKACLVSVAFSEIQWNGGN